MVEKVANKPRFFEISQFGNLQYMFLCGSQHRLLKFELKFRGGRMQSVEQDLRQGQIEIWEEQLTK